MPSRAGNLVTPCASTVATHDLDRPVESGAHRLVSQTGLMWWILHTVRSYSLEGKHSMTPAPRSVPPAPLPGLAAISGVCGDRMTVRYHTRQGRQVPDSCRRMAHGLDQYDRMLAASTDYCPNTPTTTDTAACTRFPTPRRPNNRDASSRTGCRAPGSPSTVPVRCNMKRSPSRFPVRARPDAVQSGTERRARAAWGGPGWATASRKRTVFQSMMMVGNRLRPAMR